MTEYTVDYLLSEGYCYPIAAQKRLILMDERKNVLVKHEVSQNITDVTRSRTTMQQMSVVLSSLLLNTRNPWMPASKQKRWSERTLGFEVSVWFAAVSSAERGVTQ